MPLSPLTHSPSPHHSRAAIQVHTPAPCALFLENIHVT
ncbi:hypothetical protein PACID_12560 [Acidipropionibacterium acidipropionici ATCC 4875]|uniref:Uncharacterized protein n=1 Tax=Acidipropionibacterium acidipropionici (strain ATCC 4875 / DSM 20272 / JCM 6432 / NBRC 12425 / NCIMB 8070 / 4) TaxID=1171373 RepID=K7RVR5_ACIA4|nr:hypothetical protein PACID_12560 [Acidipropionibacterium acidipropionici ATCC 4875]